MGGRVLKPESWRLMTTPRELAGGKVADYGCGLAIARQGGETVLSHGGAVSGFHASNALVPRTKSAVVVFANAEHLDSGALARELLALVLKGPNDGDAGIPKVDGPAAQDAARELLRQMRDGRVDRGQLGEEFSLYMSEERVKSAAGRLKAHDNGSASARHAVAPRDSPTHCRMGAAATTTNSGLERNLSLALSLSIGRFPTRLNPGSNRQCLL